MPVFYPSCVSHIYVRFDEAYTVVEPAEPPSTQSELTTSPVYGPSAIRPLVLQAKPHGGAEGLTGIMNRIPISCSVDLPSYRVAGTFSMEIDYRNLPIDPRLLRSASVEIYMGAIDTTDFSTGMVTVESDGSRKSVLQTMTEDGGRREDLLLIVGTVDTWHATHNSTGSRLTMTGRDLRGLLLDTKVDVRSFAQLDLKKDIVEVIKQILKVYPWGREWVVQTLDKDWLDENGNEKLPSPAEKGEQPLCRQSVSKGGAGVPRPSGGDKLNFWDLITYYCFICGAVPFFQADRIIVRRSKDLYQQSASPVGAPGAPFLGGFPRRGPDGKTFKVRKLVYGRDILEATFERKFGGIKVPTVRVESLDTSGKKRGKDKLIHAEWPVKEEVKKSKKGSGGKAAKAQTTSVSPGDEPSGEVFRHAVHGITSKKRLLEIAKALYEEMGRGEVGGSVQTKSLASFGTDPAIYDSGNTDPDLLRLRAGDAVELLTDLREIESQAPLVSSYTDSRRRSRSEQEAEIAKRFGNNQAAKELARVIVAQSSGSILQLQTIYRTGNVHFTWAKDSGINIAFDFSNYVTARAELETPDPVPTKKKKRRVSSSRNTKVGSQESSATLSDKRRG